MPSIDLGPPTAAYFPTIFVKNQFRTRPKWPPPTTDLKDKTAIVTGSNSGLGFEANRQLLSFGLSRLIIAVRSIEKGNAAASRLKQEYPQALIDVWALDMSSYDSIQAFVKKVEADLDRLDIVILNAGQYNLQYKANQYTGHEETVQVNYLSSWLLAILLLPLLRDKAPDGQPGMYHRRTIVTTNTNNTLGRLTIVNAALAYVAKFPTRHAAAILPSLDNASHFEAGDRYPTSKVLSHFFMYKLQEYISTDDVIVNMVCPGLVKGTELQSQWPTMIKWIAKSITAIPARSVDVGASTYVDAVAVQGKESHMSFLMSWEVASFAPLVYESDGKEIATKLWNETMEELKFADVEEILTFMRR